MGTFEGRGAVEAESAEGRAVVEGGHVPAGMGDKKGGMDEGEERVAAETTEGGGAEGGAVLFLIDTDFFQINSIAF